MKAHLLVACIAVASLSFLSCNKDHDCGCVPPPQQDTYWKITAREGSISGNTVPLTTAQQNNVLTLKANGEYKCTDKQTGEVVSGMVTVVSDFPSIYGSKARLVFAPALPMLDNEYYILLGNTNGKLVFGDNVTDGYTTTFSVTQP